MKTDVFIKLFSDRHTGQEMARDIEEGFRMFRECAARFTRFEKESELSRFNASEGGQVSPGLFVLLQACVRFHALTGGIFDPSVLPDLERIGYGNAGNGHQAAQGRTVSFRQLILDASAHTAYKPKDLRIDLGGIGKGHIVDMVADHLSKKYRNGIVDAGGDMRVFGGDRGQRLDHWALDVENPFDASQPITTILITDCAVATSGISRKHWEKAGTAYHHLIDPSQGTSAKTGVSQVTVIAPRAIDADVFAKTLFILGLGRGQAFAATHDIPALFVTEEKQVIRNNLFQHYEWHA